MNINKLQKHKKRAKVQNIQNIERKQGLMTHPLARHFKLFPRPPLDMIFNNNNNFLMT